MANDSIALISKSYLDRNTVTSSTQLDSVTQVGKYVDATVVQALKDGKANVVWVNNDYDDVEFSNLDDIYDYIRKCRDEGYYLFDYFFHSFDIPEKTIVATQCADGDVYFFTSLQPEYDSLIDPKRPVVKTKDKKLLYNGRPVIKKHMPMCPNERLGYYFNGNPHITLRFRPGVEVIIRTNYNIMPVINVYSPGLNSDTDYIETDEKSYRAIRNKKALTYLYTEYDSYNNSTNKYRRLYIENTSNEVQVLSLKIEGTSDKIYYVNDINRYYQVDEDENIHIDFFIDEAIIEGVRYKPTVSCKYVRGGVDYETLSPYIRLKEHGNRGKTYIYNGQNAQPDEAFMVRKIGNNEFAVNNIRNIPGLNGESGSYRLSSNRKYEHRIRKRRKLIRRGAGYYRKIVTKQLGNILFVYIKSSLLSNKEIKLTYRLASSYTGGNGHNDDYDTLNITVPLTSNDNEIVIDLESAGLPAIAIYHKYYYLSNVEIFKNGIKDSSFIWLTKPANKLTSYKKMKHNDYDKLFSGNENGNPKLVNRGKAFCLLVYPKHKGIKSVRPIKFYYNRKNFMS